MSDKVLFGFVPEFKGNATLLFLITKESLEMFADFLTLWTQHQSITDLERTNGFESPNDTSISLLADQQKPGMKWPSSDGPGKHLEWRLSVELAARFASMIRELAYITTSGHQYLESGSDEVIVMVSKDEYDQSIFLQRGA